MGIPNLPQLPHVHLPLALYTTDPALLVALVSVVVAVLTVLLTTWAMRYAISDTTDYSAFSREGQALREAAFVDQFTGRHEYMANAPHVAGSPGSLHIAGVGAAHDDRWCQRCHRAVLHSVTEQCPECDYADPDDRSLGGAA